MEKSLFWNTVYISASCACVRSGVDPTANQDGDQPATDRETFQLEFDAKAEQWRVRTADDQYWSVEAASGIQASGTAQYDFRYYSRCSIEIYRK